MAKETREVDLPQKFETARRPATKFLTRHTLVSDGHDFIGRVRDLSIVALNFETYELLARHPDCKYAFDVGDWVQTLARRVESLNLAGDLLWPENMPSDCSKFPVSRYDWLNIAADVFLMRYVSVVDCSIILTNGVYQKGINPEQCSIPSLKKVGVPLHVLSVLQLMLDDQGSLRTERNARFHHGHERFFTQDDLVFWMASTFEFRGSAITGEDRHGRKLDVARSFKEGLVGVQRDFNRSTRRLVRRLKNLYDLLGEEFEDRFRPLVAAAAHGFNAGSRDKVNP